MVSENVPMMLDDNVEVIDAAPAKDNDGIPYCKRHHCRMDRVSGGKKGSPTIYFKCQVSSCDQKEQIVKTPNPAVVPAKPQHCPRCSGVICERDPVCSTASMVILKCPACQWKSTGLAVPQLAAAYFGRGAARNPIVGVGDR